MKASIVSLIIAAAATLVAPVACQAQTGKVYRVAYLGAESAPVDAQYLLPFRKRMAEFGYVEGRNLILTTRFADGQLDSLPRLARELVDLRPDVLFVATVVAIRAASAVTTTIPIVFVRAGDPVGLGLIPSLARPGGNLTGLSSIAPELTGKRLELLKEIVPSATRVAILVNPDAPIAAIQIENAEVAARNLGVQLQLAPVRDIATLDASLETAVRAGASAGLRMADFSTNRLRVETARLAMKYRLPMMYGSHEDVEAGGLAAYGPSVTVQYEQAATFMHKILQGAKPGDIPVELPTKFELSVNLKTARTLGITIPRSVILRADRLVE